ncbi:MAG: rRNA maturation RNase YbeY [Erysipelotrichales bacterium]
MENINFINEYDPKYDYLIKEYNELMKQALNHLKLDKDYYISVTLVNNEEIHHINKEYRKIDRPTDVISFEDYIEDPFDNSIDIGDIFISVDRAIEQANDYKHSLERELSFLFVHGLLHCLGYDHQDSEEEKEMFNLQEVILDEYARRERV